ncbi:MAG: hypothetical protein WC468_01395 [Candidatus Paceibacterota bacterium]|jgi:hypothetical protein
MLGLLDLKFTPEAFFMLPLAVGLDVFGIILFCFGLDDFGMTDVIGIAIINFWLIMRNKKPRNEMGRKGALQNVRNVFTGKYTKFAVPMFGELIPYLGVLPFWTLSVLFNLSDTE